MNKGILIMGLLFGALLLFGCTSSTPQQYNPQSQPSSGSQQYNQQSQDNLIRNVVDFFPNSGDLSTEWKINPVTNPCSTGNTQSMHATFVKGSGYDTEKVTVTISLFSDINEATQYYSSNVSKIQQARGYTEISQSNDNCFGWGISSTADLQRSYCQKENMVVYVSASAFSLGWSDYTNQFNKIILQKNPKSAHIPLDVNCPTQTQVQSQNTTQPQFPAVTSLSWARYDWNQTQQNGLTSTVDDTNTLIIKGTGTNSYWNNEVQLTKPLTTNIAQISIALSALPGTASGASIRFVKDEQNMLIVEKHRDSDTKYNTNVFVIEKINGSDNFKYISTDLPSATFDTYKIKESKSGYEVYCNDKLVYSGTLDLTPYKNIELVGVSRASGDQIEAKFKDYLETSIN